MFVPFAVQWWASYYPGAEPGGGGYIAQRMFSAKDENHAIGATLLFNVCHYALRPWPWIIIALSSLIIFPDLKDIQSAFPNLPESKLGHDVAYPAMLTLLPPGLLGLVAASLIAAFMSTMSTQLNLGASYLVNDFYKRFINKSANEQQLVTAGRIFTIVSVCLGAGLGLTLTNASQAFELLLMIGAGTGLIYILRWFWWRINAYTEIVAMITSLIIAYYFNFLNDSFVVWIEIVIGAALTTITWIIATFITPPEDEKTLMRFVDIGNPGGPGWKKFEQKKTIEGWSVPKGILSMLLGSIAVYGILLGTGSFIYGNYLIATSLMTVSLICIYLLLNAWFQDSFKTG